MIWLIYYFINLLYKSPRIAVWRTRLGSASPEPGPAGRVGMVVAGVVAEKATKAIQRRKASRRFEVEFEFQIVRLIVKI